MKKVFGHSVTQLEYHLVWVTKYRNKSLNEEVRAALTDKIKQICKDNNVDIIAIMVMPNHVHLEVQVPPNISITVLMRKLKGITAKWLFQEYPTLRQDFRKHHIWSRSYFAKTTGNCSDETIKNYIETQWERDYD